MNVDEAKEASNKEPQVKVESVPVDKSNQANTKKLKKSEQMVDEGDGRGGVKS